MHCDALPQSFYERDPASVARDLLGARLVRLKGRTLTIGRIVEVEAYLAQVDPASHAFRGRTRRNSSMFGPPGRAYVYAIHSRYCLNAVTEPEGVPSAVLIRAVEPLEGMRAMHRRRGAVRPRDLARGPARLCEAFAIDRALDGWDLTRGQRLWIAPREAAGISVAVSPRVGVTSAHGLLLRYSLAESPFVSGPRHRRGIADPRPGP
jgi:DNA-3-methyladenine glycosylase